MRVQGSASILSILLILTMSEFSWANPNSMRPPIYSLDNNSVDVANGGYFFSEDVLDSPGEQRLGVVLRTGKQGWIDPRFDNFNFSAAKSTVVSISASDGNQTYTFGTLYATGPIKDGYGLGALLTLPTATAPMTLITPTGSKIEYGTVVFTGTSGESFVTKITYPDGYEVRIDRENVSSPGSQVFNATRVLQVRDNRGFALDYDYSSSFPWDVPVKVTLFNRAFRSCPVSANPCVGVGARPVANYSYVYGTNSDGTGPVIKKISMVTSAGKKVEWNWFNASRVTSVTYTDTPGKNVIVNYEAVLDPAIFIGLVNDKGSWSYNKSSLPNNMNLMQVVRNGVPFQNFEFSNNGRVYKWTDPNGRTTNYSFDSFLRPIKVLFPEGNYSTYAYDTRGNVISQIDKEKPSSGIAQRSRTAVYPASCSNTLTCNQPTSVSDFNGNLTDFTYAPEHGGVLTKSSPAADGVRPVVRNTYVQRYAWVAGPSGGYVKESSPVWVLNQTKTCLTTSTIGDTCSGGAMDEVVTTYDWGPDSGPNNLLMRGVTVASRGEVRRTCYTYDEDGRRISSTTPRAALGACQ